jgi:hypothetical protein
MSLSRFPSHLCCWGKTIIDLIQAMQSFHISARCYLIDTKVRYSLVRIMCVQQRAHMICNIEKPPTATGFTPFGFKLQRSRENDAMPQAVSIIYLK